MRNNPRKKQIYQNLAWLNDLPVDEAEAAFYGCSHSETWSRLMTDARPFTMLDDLFTRGENLWNSQETTKTNEMMVAALERLLER